jgi:hypothetical protein
MLNFRHSEISAKHVRIGFGVPGRSAGPGLVARHYSYSARRAGSSRRGSRRIPSGAEDSQPRKPTPNGWPPKMRIAPRAIAAAPKTRWSKGHPAIVYARSSGCRNGVSRPMCAPGHGSSDSIRRKLGIDPSYDLPPTKRSARRHHSDNTLQTLFFPDRLEPKLASIHSQPTLLSSCCRPTWRSGA